MKIFKVTGTQVAVPYETPVGPYRGRGKGEGTKGASALVVKVETDKGLVGWGEGNRQFETDPNGILAGREVWDVEGATAAMEAAGITPAPMSGVEMALWDLKGKHAGIPLYALWGAKVRTHVDFTACQGLKEPSEAASTSRTIVDRFGFKYLKTKAGEDANTGYGPESALDVMRRMKDIGVTHFEDPCSAAFPEILARIREEVGTKVLINMGVSDSLSVRGMLTAGAADYLMPDTPVAGGLLRVRKVAATAEAWGIPCLMHCSHDLGLKTAAITHVAAATANWSGPNDTCYHGLIDDVLTEKLTIENGQIAVPDGAGLGVEVDEEKLEKYRM
jgi:L-alanine-DL-glutamate epimerase-like enolase superfamily enzyme